MIPSTFLHREDFYYDASDLMGELDLEEEDLPELPDDWFVEVEQTELEPMFQLSADWICERLDEERGSEDGNEYSEVHKIITANLDFSKVNELIPKLYYPNGKRFKITKADLIEYCK